MTIKCEKCGKELNYLQVNRFNHDGSDDWQTESFETHENGIYIDLHYPETWTGYEFDADSEDARESIRCPYCHQFPFKEKELQEYNILRVVMFTEHI